MRSKTKTLAAVFVVTLASVFTVAYAQDRGDQGNRPDRGDRTRQQDGQRGDRGGRRFDPEQMRERMMNGIKDRLKASDDEWTVLQPRLEKVMEAQRDARVGGAGFRGGFGGRGQGGPGGDREPDTKLGKAASELQKTLEDDSASADQIKKELDAFRKARESAEADLKKAQGDLKEVLTQRQEAQLVMMGMLE